MRVIPFFFLICVMQTSLFSQTASEYFKMAKSEWANGNTEKAIELYSKAIELKPTAEAYYGRGSIKFNADDYEGAEKDYSWVISLDKGNVKAHLYRGISRFERGQWYTAIEDFAVALEADRADALANYYSGRAKIHTKDYKGASMDLRFTAAVLPDQEGGHRYLGIAKYNMRDYDGAINALNRAIKIEPNRAENYMYRGMSIIKRGTHGDGCADLTKGKELGHNEAQAMIDEYCK